MSIRIISAQSSNLDPRIEHGCGPSEEARRGPTGLGGLFSADTVARGGSAPRSACKVAAAPILLPSGPVHLPDSSTVSNGALRSNFKNKDGSPTPVVPLTSTGLTDPSHRTGQPTEVRVLFDKVETLKPGLIPPGRIALLADPERLSLVPGDRVTLTAWNQNSTGADVSQGFRFGGATAVNPLTLFEPGAQLVRVPAVPGAKPVPLEQCVDPKTGLVMAPPLPSPRTGGWQLVGTVRQGAPTTLDVQAIAVAERDLKRTPRGVSSDATQDSIPLGDPRLKGEYLHQQVQTYGNYSGSWTATADTRITIAAPGSWAYEGSGYQGLKDPRAKQAAFYVPIDVRLDSGDPRPSAFQVTTMGGTGNDPNAVRLSYFNPENPSEVILVRPGEAVTFRPGWVLRTEFLGGAATVLAVDFNKR